MQGLLGWRDTSAGMADRDIELVLVTGAGASVGLGASGTRIAAMKEWANHLSGALGARDPGIALLVGLRFGMDGMEFEQQLGRFFASARAFRDARDLMVNTSHFNGNDASASRDARDASQYRGMAPASDVQD